MVSKEILKQHLDDYNTRLGSFAGLQPPEWVRKLRSFVEALEDNAIINGQEKETLEEILRSRSGNIEHFKFRLLANSALARNIENSLNFPVRTENGMLALKPAILSTIFNFLRPEEIAQLMRLNLHYYDVLLKSAVWMQVMHRYFRREFYQNNREQNTNW